MCAARYMWMWLIDDGETGAVVFHRTIVYFCLCVHIAHRTGATQTPQCKYNNFII